MLPSSPNGRRPSDARAVNDLQARGELAKGQKVEWAVHVRPEILGGVVYNLGDTLVDASVKSLQAEFQASLSSAGLARME